MKTNPKTISKLSNLRIAIRDTFQDKNFSYKDIETLCNSLSTSVMYFYYFKYANCVDQKIDNTYKINQNFFEISVSEVYRRAQQQLKVFRKERERKQLEKNGSLFPLPVKKRDKTPKFTIESAILLLKNHGYKIMKPIQQFEEI
jgi:hypothetical protein